MSLQPPLPAPSFEPPVVSTANGPAVHPAPVPTTNGSALPKSRLPKARQGSRLLRWLIIAAVAVVVVGAGGSVFAWMAYFRQQARTDLTVVRVEYHDLQLKITERGTLEAKENHDVKCEVKTGNRGAPKIKWVVDNGQMVHGPTGYSMPAGVGIGGQRFAKKGDMLVEIDDSYLQDQAITQKIARDNAENDMVTAERAYPGLEAAITVAEQNLDKWVKGDYPQQMHDLQGQLQISISVVHQQEDRTAWVARMVKKGYMNASQAESEEANLAGDKLNQQKIEEQIAVLKNYTNPVNKLTLETALVTAKNAMQAGKTNMDLKRIVFHQQETQYLDLLEQIKQCRVYAEHDGIVVYAVPEQTRSGSGATQSIIAQGEPVGYGQKMMSIPDLSHMLVNVRIHEAFINNMRPDLKAKVRVTAAPGKILEGHVKSVANVAAPQDWMSPDVKVYPAYIEIDENVQALKLKPGLSADCTIFTDVTAAHVLAVPVTAIVSPVERGGKPRCYVLTPHGTEARDVELGISDTNFVEIKSGLNEGDEVVTSNPRALLSDKEKKAMKEEEKIVPNGGGKGPGGKGQGPGQGKGAPPADRK
jgi:HlyD family secretion protein